MSSPPSSGIPSAPAAGRLADAIRMHRGGRPREAIALYDAFLDGEPHHAEAIHASGLACAAAGIGADAVERLMRAVALAPANARFRADLGAVLQMVGRVDDAAAALAAAARLAPGDSTTWHNLGVTQAMRGQDDEALAALQRAASLKGDFAPTQLALGECLARRGDHAGALAALTRAVELDGRAAPAWAELAQVLAKLDRIADAAAAARRATDGAPNDPRGWHAAAVAAEAAGNVAAAAQAATRAVQIDPGRFADWILLATSLRRRGDMLGAIEAAERALRLSPASVEAGIECARAQLHADRHLAALRSIETIAVHHPDHPGVLFWRGQIRQAVGQSDAALADYRRVLEATPAHLGAIKGLLIELLYRDTTAPSEIREAAARWGRAMESRVGTAATGTPGRVDAARRPLRIGYVSPDFREHSVAWFALPVIEAHDPAAVEIHLYSTGTRAPDAITQRFKTLAGARWHDIAGLSTGEAQLRILDDGIDVLVDLAGHMQDSRPDIFAARAAPVQLAWLGWPSTTGLASMDARLSDAIADPPDGDGEGPERVIRLPHGFHAWRPMTAAQRDPAAAAPGPFTFGSFNTAAKMSASCIALWARILTAVPDAILHLKCRTLGIGAIAERLAAQFEAHGVSATRLRLEGARPPYAWHFASYDRVDLALDPFPYNGTTTTIEALWMGVPVLTLAGGNRHAARVGASLLMQAGLDEFVARDAADYVARAVAAAERGRRGVAERLELRARLAGSSLMDAPRLARELERSYRSEWNRKAAIAPSL
ncbi:MAG: tetratricopeptide repeat protein [Alphaproteobacteria bacterium]|nr:tetratricopeptide repeat protein [Alphaproteobacteria bacterium]